MIRIKLPIFSVRYLSPLEAERKRVLQELEEIEESVKKDEKLPAREAFQRITHPVKEKVTLLTVSELESKAEKLHDPSLLPALKGILQATKASRGLTLYTTYKEAVFPEVNTPYLILSEDFVSEGVLPHELGHVICSEKGLKHNIKKTHIPFYSNFANTWFNEDLRQEEEAWDNTPYKVNLKVKERSLREYRLGQRLMQIEYLEKMGVVAAALGLTAFVIRKRL